jgi:hypothetical protein
METSDRYGGGRSRANESADRKARGLDLFDAPAYRIVAATRPSG